jgi:hypothetical protein
VKRLDVLLDLLERYGTVRDLSDFLQSRGIGFANTWEKMKDSLRTSFKKGGVTEETLLTYLRDAEEYGKQHVFLFKRVVQGSPIPTQQHIKVWLRDQDAEDVLEKPRVLELPEAPEIVEVRRDPFEPGEVLVFKIVEARTYDTLVDTTPIVNGRFSRKYEREIERGVNIVRVHPTGLIEVRVYQHKGGSVHYDDELNKILQIMDGLIDRTTLHPYTLAKAKKKLYDERHNLSGEVSFSGINTLDSDGVSHSSACKRQTNMFEKEKTERSVAVLTEDDDTYHNALNIYWLKQEKKRPKEDMHVLLSGQVNEFAVTHRCSRGDYEHVLGQVLKFNK